MSVFCTWLPGDMAICEMESLEEAPDCRRACAERVCYKEGGGSKK